MKLLTLLLLAIPSHGQTDDDVISSASDTRPTRLSGGSSSASRPTSSRPDNTRPTSSSSERPGSSTSNNSNITNDDNMTDDEAFLPCDDEWYLPPSSMLVRVFAAGNSDDWGSPENNTNSTDTNFPVLLDEDNIMQVAAGQVHSVLLTEDGILMTGGIVEGGLGLGRSFTEGFGPVTEVYGESATSSNMFDGDSAATDNATRATTAPPKFVKVYASQYFTIAMDESGNAWSTGSNFYGQLCLGGGADRNRFEMINPEFYGGSRRSKSRILVQTTPPPEGVFDELESNSTRIIDVALGERHTLLLREDGVVFACGWNQFGQLGLDSTESSVFQPVQVMLNESVTEMAAGRGSSYFLTKNKTVYVTGANFDGELCLGDREDRPIPTKMDPFQKDDGLDGSDTEVQSLTAGKASLYVLLSDGQVLGCGENTHGQLGLNDTNSTSVDIATLLPLQDVISVFSGPVSYAAYFVQVNGTVYAVGYDGGGHLGVGDNMNRNALSAVACSDASAIDKEMASNIMISSGNDHTLFLGTEATFLCADGDDGPTASPSTQIPTTTRVPTTSPTITASPTATPMPTSSTGSPTVDDSNGTIVNETFVPTASSTPTLAPSSEIPSPDELNSGNKLTWGFTISLVLALLVSLSS
ncbi:hypothetical protein ACHAXN_011833 [Cyclotella atomus]